MADPNYWGDVEELPDESVWTTVLSMLAVDLAALIVIALCLPC